MILVIKSILTIILFVILTGGILFIISEIREFKNWTRLVVALLLLILTVIDILILWFT